MKNKRYLISGILATILCIVVVTSVSVHFSKGHGTANAQQFNPNLFASKTDLQNTITNLQLLLQTSYATKSDLSSISKDLQQLKSNQNALFESLKQMNNDTKSLENRVIALEQRSK